MESLLELLNGIFSVDPDWSGADRDPQKVSPNWIGILFLALTLILILTVIISVIYALIHK